jgi:hypothetical protein
VINVLLIAIVAVKMVFKQNLSNLFLQKFRKTPIFQFFRLQIAERVV